MTCPNCEAMRAELDILRAFVDRFTSGVVSHPSAITRWVAVPGYWKVRPCVILSTRAEHGQEALCDILVSPTEEVVDVPVSWLHESREMAESALGGGKP